MYISIADATWLSTALLHKENPQALDFSIKEIVENAKERALVSGARPGLQVHASKHCVANKSPNPARHKMLFKTHHGRRRLFKAGDPFHPDREDGKLCPEREELPPEFRPLVDWYNQVYSNRPKPEELVSHTVVDRRPRRANHVHDLHSETVFIGPGASVVLPDFLLRELNLHEGSCLNLRREDDHIVIFPITEDYIARLRGSVKGDFSLLEDLAKEHRDEKYK